MGWVLGSGMWVDVITPLPSCPIKSSQALPPHSFFPFLLGCWHTPWMTLEATCWYLGLYAESSHPSNLLIRELNISYVWAICVLQQLTSPNVYQLAAVCHFPKEKLKAFRGQYTPSWYTGLTKVLRIDDYREDSNLALGWPGCGPQHRTGWMNSGDVRT